MNAKVENTSEESDRYSAFDAFGTCSMFEERTTVFGR